MWSEVFLTQARSDWDVSEHLKETSLPTCHMLHYLQMATEKLAKAYLLAGPTDIKSVRSTHRAVTRFLQLLSRNEGLREEMGMKPRQLRTYVQQILPLAHKIESLAPSLAGNGPNPEYPWKAPAGAFHAPATHEFEIDTDLDNSLGFNLIKLMRTLLAKFKVLHTA